MLFLAHMDRRWLPQKHHLSFIKHSSATQTPLSQRALTEVSKHRCPSSVYFYSGNQRNDLISGTQRGFRGEGDNIRALRGVVKTRPAVSLLGAWPSRGLHIGVFDCSFRGKRCCGARLRDGYGDLWIQELLITLIYSLNHLRKLKVHSYIILKLI